jgi:hypothetical protein
LFTTETGKGYYRMRDVTKRIAWKTSKTSTR